jgi:hypothetical protein
MHPLNESIESNDSNNPMMEYPKLWIAIKIVFGNTELLLHHFKILNITSSNLFIHSMVQWEGVLEMNVIMLLVGSISGYHGEEGFGYSGTTH